MIDSDKKFFYQKIKLNISLAYTLIYNSLSQRQKKYLKKNKKKPAFFGNVIFKNVSLHRNFKNIAIMLKNKRK
jgi:hypothetical protein